MSYSYQIRGTNGTGKTTIVRKLLQEFHCLPHEHSGRKVRVYRGDALETPVYILGSYETDCGGCDTIPSVQEVADLLRKYMAEPGSLTIFEGLMISHMLGTVGAAQEQIGKDRCVLAYLDTPLEVCIERVVDRRLARGDLRSFNPRNVITDHGRVWQNKLRADKLGYRTKVISHKDAYNEVLRDVYELARTAKILG
jgi:adenylylsulfate kinase-like enzyme